MNRQKKYRVIGLMSGTSLDGLDLCYAEFHRTKEIWTHHIIATQTVAYPTEIWKKLSRATKLSGEEFCLLDNRLGVFFSDAVNRFIARFHIERSSVDAICSHGHTVFHQPDKQLTVQIGSPTAIARYTGIPTINNFRQKDVLHGGQGAPLVPIGDLLLFSDLADSFLNIGGFANFSQLQNQTIRSASDICPANILINYFALQLGYAYDKNGEIAKNTEPNVRLLEQLNALPYYRQQHISSLGWEWVEKEVIPVIESVQCSVPQKIATITQHVAFQIARKLNEYQCKKIFVTGGGAKNIFLIDRLQRQVHGDIIVAPQQLIDFKEALIFGFLGVLFMENIPNCLCSVTGATKSVVGGQLLLP